MKRLKRPLLIEHELRNNRPFIVLRCDARGRTDQCPFCGDRHYHEPMEGHRVAHCTTTDAIAIAPDGTMLHQGDGYVIRFRDEHRQVPA